MRRAHMLPHHAWRTSAGCAAYASTLDEGLMRHAGSPGCQRFWSDSLTRKRAPVRYMST